MHLIPNYKAHAAFKKNPHKDSALIPTIPQTLDWMANPDNKKKKNSKSMPLGINIGCNLGIGGIVLLGGGLVTVALVSALARRQHRSSSNVAINNKNQLELMMKKSNELNQDFGLQNSRFA